MFLNESSSDVFVENNCFLKIQIPILSYILYSQLKI